jgi:hypothetical protein
MKRPRAGNNEGVSSSTAVALNIVLDTAIVFAILAVLVWGIRAQVRDLSPQVRERRGAERRHAVRAVPAQADRRRAERRSGRPATA